MQRANRADPPLVYVVILNWNYWQETLVGLESALHLDYPSCRIVIVDNGSTNDSVGRIQEWTAGRAPDQAGRTFRTIQVSELRIGVGGTGPEHDSPPASHGTYEEARLTLLRSDTNLGFAGGCNTGIEYVLGQGADYILLMNNDARFQPTALSALVSVSMEAGAAIVGARVLDGEGRRVLFTGREWPAHGFGFVRVPPGNQSKQSYWETGDVDGAAFLARADLLKERFRQCGFYFDPAYFMYCEDVDLCLYGQRLGYRCVVARDAVALHSVGKSSGGMFNPRSYYYMTRNRIYLANHWMNLLWRTLFHLYYTPSRLARLAFLLLRRQSGWGSLAKAVLNGLYDGYRGTMGQWSGHNRTVEAQSLHSPKACR